MAALPPLPPDPDGAPGVRHVPSTRTVSVYCGLVAFCSLWNAALEATPIWSPMGTDEIGSSHEKLSEGPSYMISMTAVCVSFPLSAKMMRSAA